MNPAQMVQQFHARFGLPAADTPVVPPGALARLRQRLLSDEVAEVAEAVESGDLRAIAQELADVVYVVYGTALTYGIDLDAVLAEVHRANMTKSGVAEGKAVKGPGFQPPDLSGILP
ncbi:MazG nucleotide pyrophosphohydrolase domain-containing protein [Sphaerisporangium sp. NPDC049002]|uniref:MazG nucleotide pyrophosphohydrolase domain-containing protein n=1 Tax=Sphaerisporangium sp. NPDC049002 TaxID=3155392 RepID=UPI0033EF6073